MHFCREWNSQETSPPEAGVDNALWKLKKCVYGLADASLYWYNKVKELMLNSGGKMSQVDPAVFYWQKEQFEVTGVLACHVDDYLGQVQSTL